MAGQVIQLGIAGSRAANHIAASRGWSVITTSDLEEVAATLRQANGHALIVADLDQLSTDSLLFLSRTCATTANNIAIGFLERWPGAAVATTSCIEESVLDEMTSALSVYLRTIAATFAAHYDHVIRTQGPLHVTQFWTGAFNTAREERHPECCAYCGEPIDVRVQSPRVGTGMARSLCYCHGCGLVCDGYPEMAIWIEAPAVVNAGTRINVRLSVRNLYGTPTSVFVVVGLEDFARNRTTLTPVIEQRSMLQEEVISTELEVKEGLFPGVHSMTAMVMVGAKVNFLRRLIRISRAE